MNQTHSNIMEFLVCDVGEKTLKRFEKNRQNYNVKLK